MAIFLSTALEMHALAGGVKFDDSFIAHIHSKVHETIINSEKVPGLGTDEFQSIKPDVAKKWNALATQGVIEVTDTDAKVRPAFVALQAIVEDVFSKELGKSVKSLTGVIHTPMPATPLCTQGEISPELVSSEVAADPLRAFTVKARVTILRDYLHLGGTLYVAYPREGAKKRTEGQLNIYKTELAKYETRLFDRPLDMPEMDAETVGAFYIVENQEGKKYAFAIKMTQATSPQDMGSFGLWFGQKDSSPIAKRIESVMQAISKHSKEPIAF